MTLDVLVVEPWYGGSHRAWADAYVDASSHRVRLVSHPGTFWRWRLRGAAVTLAEAIVAHVAVHGRPDVAVVSSLVDVAQLTGLVRRELDGCPIVVYLHENQVAYPHPEAGDADAAWRGWTSLLAADLVVINSAHHRRILTGGLERLVATSPDQGHGHLLPEVLSRIEVVPVGVRLPAPARPEPGPPVVIWNHRWDDDKQPDVFIRAVERIAGDGADLRVVLAGVDDWDGAPRLRAAADRLGSLVLAAGPFDHDDYLAWLRRSDVVVSVARHEFFGVSVVEAISAGCVPVLPDEHSYPELVSDRYRHLLYGPGGFRRALQEVVADLPGARVAATGLDQSMQRFDHRTVARRLDALLEDLATADG